MEKKTYFDSNANIVHLKRNIHVSYMNRETKQYMEITIYNCNFFSSWQAASVDIFLDLHY